MQLSLTSYFIFQMKWNIHTNFYMNHDRSLHIHIRIYFQHNETYYVEVVAIYHRPSQVRSFQSWWLHHCVTGYASPETLEWSHVQKLRPVWHLSSSWNNARTLSATFFFLLFFSGAWGGAQLIYESMSILHCNHIYSAIRGQIHYKQSFQQVQLSDGFVVATNRPRPQDMLLLLAELNLLDLLEECASWSWFPVFIIGKQGAKKKPPPLPKQHPFIWWMGSCCFWHMRSAGFMLPLWFGFPTTLCSWDGVVISPPCHSCWSAELELLGRKNL